jgi:peptidoglycan hydrolase-like protein with peptidoglycan-binding domain
MQLQSSELNLQAQGAEVELLHRELRELGHELPAEEVERSVFGEGTGNAVLHFQRHQNLPPTGVVNEETAKRINEALEGKQRRFVVQGTVRLAKSNTAAKGVLVRAFGKDPRSEDLLGEAVSDEQGSYRITYDAAQFARAEKNTADLIVRAFSPQGVLLRESKDIFDASPTETVDLVVRLPKEIRLSELERCWQAWRRCCRICRRPS